MKQKGGIWVPDRDSGILNDLPLVAGVPAYQLDRLHAALDYIPVRRRRRAVDVGAHVGLWTLHMARHFNRVDAFEPVPENIACWLKNCEQHANVWLWHEALGSSEGELQLAQDRGRSWGWTADAKMVRRAQGDVITVPVATLDSRELVDVALLKIDVEGHEYDVLQGAVETLCRCHPVVVIEEKHDPHCRASEYLAGVGMREVWRKKHDRVFAW